MAVDPVLRLGPLSVRWYGVFISLAAALGVLIARREGLRRGLSADAIYSGALWSLVGGLIGARVFHVVDALDFYIQNPTAMLSLQKGGLAIWGGILGAVVAGSVYCRVVKTPRGRLADAAAPALMLGMVVGRIGSLINGDAYGASVDLPWSLVYAHPDALIPDLGEPTHPYPLYEMLWCALCLAVVWRLRRRPMPEGTLFVLAVALFAVGRFALGFLRQDPLVLFGLQQAQIVSLVALAFALPRLISRRRSLLYSASL
jgi:phosphatidylglycerol:prolipoprotein diacylglycerol transferase